MEGIDPGTYRVTARAVGFASAELYPIALGDESPSATADLTLDRGWILRGRVVDPQDRGIPGAIVVVAPPGASESGSLPTRSGPDGAFKVTAVTDGPVNVAAIPSQWAPAQLTNVMPPAEENGPGLVLRASPGGALRIRVVRRDGSPAAGVQTAIRADPLFPGWDYAADHNRPRPTDTDGTTVVSLLYPGDYWVAVSGRGDVPTVRVTVGEGTETPALLRLP